MRSYDYYYEKIINAKLDIEHPGNCAIEALTKEGANYYLVITTFLGITSIFKYGPVIPDIELLPHTVTCSYERINYSESKINKTIDLFLNNSKLFIVSATEVEKNYALANCVDIIDYVRKGVDCK